MKKVLYRSYVLLCSSSHSKVAICEREVHWTTTDVIQVDFDGWRLIFNEVADFQHKDLVTSTQGFGHIDAKISSI